ncbi:MAG: hypothetical protein V7K67_06030 [Nostoc sp.]|uniref:hypothetical protein n=1 Tax=Nostoc sp. TaxID=1180 RepID=UPI002FEE9A22
MCNGVPAQFKRDRFPFSRLIRRASDRNQTTLPNADSRRLVNSTGASPVLIKQRYGYQEFHSQPEHWKLVGFLTFPYATITKVIV